MKILFLSLFLSCLMAAQEDPIDNADVKKMDLSGNKFTHIHFIVQFPALESLNLEGCDRLKNNYSPVRSLSALITLNLNQTYCTDLTYLARLRCLKELQLVESRVEYIEPITHHLALTHLNLFGCNMVRDIHLIGRIGTLTHLNMACVFNDEDISYPPLEFLAGLTNLQALDISYNLLIEDCSMLPHLPYLRKLKIGACDLIPDYRFLPFCTRLEKLYITADHLPESVLRCLPNVEITFQHAFSRKLP